MKAYLHVHVFLKNVGIHSWDLEPFSNIYVISDKVPTGFPVFLLSQLYYQNIPKDNSFWKTDIHI